MLIYLYSSGRSDIDRYSPFIKILSRYKSIDLKIIPSFVYFNSKFGLRKILNNHKVDFLKRKSSKILDKRNNINYHISNEIKYLTNLIEKNKPDIFIVLGDRYEMLSVPISCLNYNIPVIHIYGGAVTEGAIDELIRHSITKMSHIHFVATQHYKKRLIQMGEQNFRIKNIGVANLENINKNLKTKKELSIITSLNLDIDTVIVTYHPVTLESKRLKFQIDNLLRALKILNCQVIFTFPNNDYGFSQVIKDIRKFTNQNKKKYIIIKNATAEIYYALLSQCKLMIGNSSSGLVEASYLKIPAINIGTRQDGKIKPKNVIDCDYDYRSILRSYKKANDKKFRESVKKMVSPYYKKNSAKMFAKKILGLKINDKLLRKKFINIK